MTKKKKAQPIDTDLVRGEVVVKVHQMNGTLAMHEERATGSFGPTEFRLLSNVFGINPIVAVKAKGDSEETWYTLELPNAIEKVIALHDTIAPKNRGKFPEDGKVLRDLRDSERDA